GSRIVWPMQPALQGVTKSLLEAACKREGIESVSEPVNVRDMSEFSAAFLSNSVGVAPVGRIGAQELGDPGPVVELLGRLYESTPWDEI
ncbi:MAG: class IV aminotransferase, partial [bacterium]|nr:class IV aminotransferase [bacterium]